MRQRLGFLAAAGLATWGLCAAPARAEDLPPAPPEPPASQVLLAIPPWERFVERVDRWRTERPLQVEVGGVHWVNVNRETEKATYGYPGGEGTYYWWAKLHLEAPLADGGDAAFGAHVEMRLRERTRLASYYDSRLWLQEAYLFADALGGRWQAGKITGVFGLETDATWWCCLPYYDGFQYDPDWGVSYARTLVERPCFRLDATAQVFVAEDHVNGSNPGADAESDDERDEGLSTILRVVPTWTFSGGATLSVGLSGTVGRIVGNGVPDDTLVGGALDVVLVNGPWTLRGAAYLVDGVRHGANYVTGGPSARLEDYVLCGERRLGPVTLRASWSGSRLRDPDGDQSLWILGGSIALVRNVDLYLEYVRWTAQADGSDEVTLEDGFQLILQWHL